VLFCVFLMAAFIARSIVLSRNRARPRVVQSISASSDRHAERISSPISPAFDIEKRRLYPYSVIPGGVEDVGQLRNAIAHDRLVSAHYANFDLARARIVRLDRDETVHVSFRLNERIYWTRKTLLLRKGETVISDGTHEARTRCGNRISTAPEMPVAPQEPSAEAMDAPPKFPLVAKVPEIWPTPEPILEPLIGGESTPPGAIIPPAAFPVVGGGSAPDPLSATPPVAAPEPGALALLALGLFTLGFYRRLAHFTRKFSRRT